MPNVPYRACVYTPASLIQSPWGWDAFQSKCVCLFPLNEQKTKPASKIVPYTDEKQANLSQVSFGETGGLYPTVGAQKLDLYDPEKWDPDMTEELLKCRAAVTMVAKRGERHKTTMPNVKNPLVRKLAAYHLTDNFPAADKEISADPDVRFFYLSPDKDARHTGINYAIWDVKMVKAYGPFYNIGGGDVAKGPTYVLFYSVKKKQK